MALQHTLYDYDALPAPAGLGTAYFAQVTVDRAYVHHGCILAEDCALLYAGGASSNGTVWRRSVLHDSGMMCARASTTRGATHPSSACSRSTAGRGRCRGCRRRGRATTMVWGCC